MPVLFDPSGGVELDPSGGLAEIFRNQIGRPSLPYEVAKLLNARGSSVNSAVLLGQWAAPPPPAPLPPGTLRQRVFNAGLEPLDGFSWPPPRQPLQVPFVL